MEAKHTTAQGQSEDVLLQFLTSLPLLRHAHASTVSNIAWGVTVCAFVASSFLFIRNPDRATLIERPTQTASLGFFISGLAIIAIYVFIRAGSRIDNLGHETLPLVEETSGGDTNSSASRYVLLKYASSKHLGLILIVIAILARVHLFEHVSRKLQCAIPGVEGILPILAARRDSYGSSGENGLSSSRSRLIYTYGPALLMSCANILAARTSAFPRSTTICPEPAGSLSLTLVTQWAGVCLDALILRSFAAVLTGMQSQKSSRPRNGILLIGIVFVISGILLPISGLLKAIVPQYRAILSSINVEFVWHVLWASMLFVSISISSMRLLSLGSSLHIVLIISAMISYFNIRTGLQNIASSVAPLIYYPLAPPLIPLFMSLVLFFAGPRLANSTGRPFRNVVLLSTLLIMGLLIAWNTSLIYKEDYFDAHPIDGLMQTAELHYQGWTQDASSSQSIEEAIAEYVRRYKRYPPPGFDKWYIYATERSSLVIDNYDSIEENLRPFWGVEPQELRARIKLLLANTENDCAEVSLRSGNATIGRVVPTHRWMVDGVINMMKNFKDALPDMDIAFNINDEPRVAIPYDVLKSLVISRQSTDEADELVNAWSKDRAAAWESSLPEGTSPTKLTSSSFNSIWREYGSVACSPDSPARQVQVWDSTVLCTSCYAPHSTGPFLRDWKLAASPCHQPDISHLHGFYLGPSAFKGTHELVPIFSQSRAGGFADILYPSAWNYNDKVKYDPNGERPDVQFIDKDNSLFWRGGTTEGFSEHREWMSSTRQRLVDVATKSTRKAPVLLHTKHGYSYQSHSIQSLQSALRNTGYSNDVGFVDKFVRCDLGDCEAQLAHFGLAGSTDFQDHWKHRFLLDADGAGFSGRFLSFLQSHSLPIKTAIFREWYDDRVVPWKHFVPVDIRLHGIWSTLSYFATNGFRQGHGGKDPGELIAEAGREMAGKYLRKEDMEIYFYRLLLEYARVMDDNRDQLGYTGRN